MTRKGYSTLSLFFALLAQIRSKFPLTELWLVSYKKNLLYWEFCSFSRHRTPSHQTRSRFRNQVTLGRLHTVQIRLDKYLANQEVFDHDELLLNPIDILSNGQNQYHLDLEAGYGYKTDGERFHAYWLVTVAGTKSDLV